MYKHDTNKKVPYTLVLQHSFVEPIFKEKLIQSIFPPSIDKMLNAIFLTPKS